MLLGIKDKLEQIRSALTIIRSSLSNADLQFILFKDYGIKVSTIKQLAEFDISKLDNEDDMIAIISSFVTGFAIKLIQKSKTLRADSQLIETGIGHIDKQKVNDLLDAASKYDSQIKQLVSSSTIDSALESELLRNLAEYRSTLKIINALR